MAEIHKVLWSLAVHAAQHHDAHRRLAQVHRASAVQCAGAATSHGQTYYSAGSEVAILWQDRRVLRNEAIDLKSKACIATTSQI